MPHVPLFAGAAFAGRSPRGAYGDVVEEIDDGVGRVLATLAELGLDRRTDVVAELRRRADEHRRGVAAVEDQVVKR